MVKNFGSRMDQMRLEAELANSQQDNRSRSRIAYGFTFAFITFIGVILIGGPIYNATIGHDNLIDIADTLSGFVAQFGTPLGFVLGYYFKDKNNN